MNVDKREGKRSKMHNERKKEFLLSSGGLFSDESIPGKAAATRLNS